MDKIEKALSKFSVKERDIVRKILNKLRKEDVLGLSIEKLKGRADIFRVRKGNIRIIYQKEASDGIFILAIERRSEKTYRKF